MKGDKIKINIMMLTWNVNDIKVRKKKIARIRKIKSRCSHSNKDKNKRKEKRKIGNYLYKWLTNKK